MTTMTPDPPIPAESSDPLEVVVDLPAGSSAATLSCRLHGVIGGAATGTAAALTVVVEAGDRAADPDVARVLACARDCAVSRGLGFVVR
ncbi:hypothetical protein [Actinomycetospora lemnae]|uniref:Uncharacterized protein n=1 Tax=Actinomycetospora lemnae TaxID=3019891 RepID=A0ABT5SPX9_9PSEU|nr:hypothetical protein [Actinomycetospora sp. DW7H6]MDD7964904.1 hypothetical protein [Actinomycetospora sp. DW7H6]